MKTKKLIPAIIILLCCMLLFTATVMQIYRKVQFEFHCRQYAIDNFSEKKQAFEDVVATVSGFYEEAIADRSDVKWISVVQGAGHQWEITYVTNDHNLNDPDRESYTIYKERSQQDIENYKIILQSFKKDCQGLLDITVSSDSVTFRTGFGYSVIYIKNGKATKYILRQHSEAESFYFDKISSKWYQVVSSCYQI